MVCETTNAWLAPLVGALDPSQTRPTRASSRRAWALRATSPPQSVGPAVSAPCRPCQFCRLSCSSPVARLRSRSALRSLTRAVAALVTPWIKYASLRADGRAAQHHDVPACLIVNTPAHLIVGAVVCGRAHEPRITRAATFARHDCFRGAGLLLCALLWRRTTNRRGRALIVALALAEAIPAMISLTILIKR
jgi:hypothetical protein